MTIVTTARKPTDSLVARARELSLESGYPYLERGKLNLENLLTDHDNFLLLSSKGLSCFTREGGELYFHPSMAVVRLKQLRKGGIDLMLEAMNLAPGDRVLDCTAGLCSDSLVSQLAVGEEGEVVALELSPLIYWVVRFGLDNYQGAERLTDLARRVRLLNADFRDYLSQVKPDSFDVVYFDPMFQAPVQASSSLTPLRPLACHHPLTRQDILLALRAAKKRVVVKQRSFFKFKELGLTKSAGGTNSPIGYGVLEKEGGRR